MARGFLIWSLLAVTSCVRSAANITVAPGVELSGYRTVAVSQFEDRGRHENSGDAASRAFEGALLTSGRRVLPYNRRGEADAVLRGSVTESRCDRDRLPPCWIEIAFQLLDARTGDVVMTGSVGEDGSSSATAAQRAASKLSAKLGTIK
jgi:hypothetical protein